MGHIQHYLERTGMLRAICYGQRFMYGWHNTRKEGSTTTDTESRERD
jgi:hypothetical protein